MQLALPLTSMRCVLASCTSLPATILTSGIDALDALRWYKSGTLLVAAVDFILGVKFHLYLPVVLHEAGAK